MGGRPLGLDTAGEAGAAVVRVDVDAASKVWIFCICRACVANCAWFCSRRQQGETSEQQQSKKKNQFES